MMIKNVGYLNGVNPFAVSPVPTADGIRRPPDRQEPRELAAGDFSHSGDARS